MKLPEFGHMFGQMKDMQQKIVDLQDEVKSMKFTGETGGGMVKATVNGQSLLQDLQIDPTLLEPDEMSILTDLIKKAIQQAQYSSKEGTAAKIKEISGGLGNVPGLDQFFR